jgi:uncharacterized surface protein with fasciclin (FAS1) repeats
MKFSMTFTNTLCLMVAATTLEASLAANINSIKTDEKINNDSNSNLRSSRRELKEQFDCKICGDGKMVTLFEAAPNIPFQPVRTCQDLLDANEKGNISEGNCGLLYMFTRNVCGCRPTPAPTPSPVEATPAPTGAPVVATTAPTATVTLAPTAMPVEATPDLVRTALERNFTYWVTALEATNLVHVMETSGPYTVFVPDDEAFAALPEGMFDALVADDIELLGDIVLYHVLQGVVPSSSLEDGSSFPTLSGNTEPIDVRRDGEAVSFNEHMASLLEKDIQAGNGLLHGISGVLIPPTFNMTVNMTDYSNMTTALSP